MKIRRSGGKPLNPKMMWPCGMCGKANKSRVSITSDPPGYWTDWACFMKRLTTINPPKGENLEQAP